MSSNTAIRNQYLSAMGIPVWARRPVRTNEPGNHVGTTIADVSDAGLSGTSTKNKVTHCETDSAWHALQQEVQACVRCTLHKSRKQTVFGVGDPNATWLFIGEAPGADEDRRGEPFVGRAGQLLNAMIFSLGLKREEVYIANVLKCRPPNNRDPQPNEVEQCEPYLIRQIDLIRPGIIVALGRHAAHSLLRSELPLSKLRARRLSYHGIPLVATYHPAYLLRSPLDKRKAWADLCLARSVVEAS